MNSPKVLDKPDSAVQSQTTHPPALLRSHDLASLSSAVEVMSNPWPPRKPSCDHHARLDHNCSNCIAMGWNRTKKINGPLGFGVSPLFTFSASRKMGSLTVASAKLSYFAPVAGLEPELVPVFFFANKARQMMYVAGETGDPPVETTAMIEEIVREQVVEIVSSSSCLIPKCCRRHCSTLSLLQSTELT